MRVVDTSAWIEWLIDSKTAGKFAAEIPRRDAFIVPTIVQFELQKWLDREASAQRAEEVIALTSKCVVIPLGTTISIRAAIISTQYKLSATDAIIYATAQQHGADVLTCDAHFEGLPGVIYISKS